MQNRTRIYLDNAATTPLSVEAREAMEPYFTELFGNASSPYAVSRAARAAVDQARSQVATLVGAFPDEIVFTSGGTESDNWALMGMTLARLPERGHILVSSVEHHAILEPAETSRDLGFGVERIPVNNDGVVEPGLVERMLRPDTVLVSVMAVNNETGVCQPVSEIGALARAHGIAFHCDAVQAAGKMAIDVAGRNVDMLSLSAHKFGGPKGVGALYLKRGQTMRAWQRGGAQERGRRAGTENVPGIVGMGAAAEAARRDLAGNSVHLGRLRAKLEEGVRGLGASINGAGAQRAPHIVNFTIPGRRAESLALQLDLRGIAVGTGSACASGALEPSHVLIAMGQSTEEAKSSLRVSFGTQNTEAEIDEFVKELTTEAQRRRGKER